MMHYSFNEFLLKVFFDWGIKVNKHSKTIRFKNNVFYVFLSSEDYIDTVLKNM